MTVSVFAQEYSHLFKLTNVFHILICKTTILSQEADGSVACNWNCVYCSSYILIVLTVHSVVRHESKTYVGKEIR